VEHKKNAIVRRRTIKISQCPSEGLANDKTYSLKVHELLVCLVGLVDHNRMLALSVAALKLRMVLTAFNGGAMIQPLANQSPPW
jgi:hypothetical protein